MKLGIHLETAMLLKSISNGTKDTLSPSINHKEIFQEAAT